MKRIAFRGLYAFSSGHVPGGLALTLGAQSYRGEEHTARHA